MLRGHIFSFVIFCLIGKGWILLPGDDKEFPMNLITTDMKTVS